MEITKIDHIKLSDGHTYTGYGYYGNGEFIPHGVGKKFYDGYDVWGNYEHGKVNGPAINNHHSYMYASNFVNNRANGWGLSMNRGILTQFGYYKNSELKTDLTDMVEWFYEKVIKFWDDHKSGMATVITNRMTLKLHELLIGWSYKVLSSGCTRHQMGFHFMLDGTLWVGVTDKFDMTGTLMKFQNDGHIVIGKFQKGELVEPISFNDWFLSYTSMPPKINFKFDPNKNYFED